MIYTVTWKKMPGKAVIRTETYTDLAEAIDQANVAIVGGPDQVEVTVTDSDGFQHHIQVTSRA